MKPSDDQPLLPFEFSPPPPPAASPRPAEETAPLPAAPLPPAAGAAGSGAEAEGMGPAESARVDATELAEWKDALRRDFEAWLASLDALPEPEKTVDEELDDGPDLYAFYEQLAAASAESRKANRRTAEAMSQWGDTLARFEGGLQPLRETVAQLAAVQPKAGRMPRVHCLLLVELLDRMYRLADAFATPPAAKPLWWGAAIDRTWRERWTAQQQALDILVGHFEGLLTKEGVTRIDTQGQPFDPARMVADATEIDATLPPQTVIEEIAAGYLREGELLRAAHVKVSRPS